MTQEELQKIIAFHYKDDTDEGISRIIIDMLWPRWGEMNKKIKSIRYSLQIKDYRRHPDK